MLVQKSKFFCSKSVLLDLKSNSILKTIRLLFILIFSGRKMGWRFHGWASTYVYSGSSLKILFNKLNDKRCIKVVFLN